ncbi:hypothetical protein [Furfurilactobacillus entadae]|uniref:hypothetical protein n=1 Tax=Furfurilactobacillus entadae TaxID=2922307 RepID=UPI0035E98056
MLTNALIRPLLMQYKCVNIFTEDGNYVLDSDGQLESIWSPADRKDNPGAKWLVGCDEDDGLYRLISNSNGSFLQKMENENWVGTMPNSIKDMVADWSNSLYQWDFKFITTAEGMAEVKIKLVSKTEEAWINGVKNGGSLNMVELINDGEKAASVKVMDVGMSSD